MDEYETFTRIGKDTKPTKGYKRISVHFVYDGKHDGRHKVRYVTDGHRTELPLESVYSGVVTL